MPLYTKTGRPNKDTEAMNRAKGKINHSYANALFGTINDLFYEFGVINQRPPKKNHENNQEE